MNGKENYSFDGNQMRIVFSYYLNGERLAAGLDKNGEMIPLTSTTVLIPKENTKKDDIILTLAWLNTSVFAKTEALKGKLSASGGRALYRDYVAKMEIPVFPEDIKQEIVRFSSTKLNKGMNQHDLQILDNMFSDAIEIVARTHSAARKIKKSAVKNKKKKAA
jgi:hypothetical protein